MIIQEYLAKITQWQLERQQQYQLVPPEVREIEYLGKTFIVYQDVFWPNEDSHPLVENYVINPGETVLDVCTGSSVIAVFSAYKQASKVVALDNNPNAVKAATENAQRHGFEKTIDVVFSDMFESLGSQKFDVITGNLPFRDLPADNYAALSQWDPNLKTHHAFFDDVGSHLKPNGRIYLSQANYGEVDRMIALAREARFDSRLIGEKPIPIDAPGFFYAFELLRT